MKRLLLLLALLAACSRSLPEPPERPPLSGPARAWAALVQSRHAEADRLLDGGDAAGARQVLASLVAAPVDRGVPVDTRRVLLQDTYFRLARLDLEAKQARASADHATAGLALGGGDDVFVANLLVARGAAREALGEAQEALVDYDRALRINELLLQRTLGPP